MTTVIILSYFVEKLEVVNVSFRSGAYSGTGKETQCQVLTGHESSGSPSHKTPRGFSLTLWWSVVSLPSMLWRGTLKKPRGNVQCATTWVFPWVAPHGAHPKICLRNLHHGSPKPHGPMASRESLHRGSVRCGDCDQ